MTCPCCECELYPGDYEDTGNGVHIVYCEDNKIRTVDIDAGCAWFRQDPFVGIKDIQ